MIPDLDLARVRRWVDECNDDIPPHVRGELRYEIEMSDRAITVLECRPPWDDELGAGWTRLPVCRFRYTKAHKQWSLYWRDQHQKFHLHKMAEPTPHLTELIDFVRDDESGIFWG